MRLPTVTKKQTEHENSRELHEGIWFAHLAGKPFLVAGEPEPFKSDRAAWISGNLNSFWLARGFRIHVRLTETRRIAITLTATPAKQRNYRREPVDTAWTQPAA